MLRVCISGEVSDTHFYFQVKWIISMFTCTSVSNIQTRAKSLILFFLWKTGFLGKTYKCTRQGTLDFPGNGKTYEMESKLARFTFKVCILFAYLAEFVHAPL